MDRPPFEPDQTDTFSLVPEDAPSVVEPEQLAAPEWLETARADLIEPGSYIIYEETKQRRIVPITREWTRVGRSLSADIRFDDTTVSRRHALIVLQADGVRVLDDRSLNGVQVNGRRVEWSELRDGDEIVVGRHRLYFVVAVANTASHSANQPPEFAVDADIS